LEGVARRRCAHVAEGNEQQCDAVNQHGERPEKGDEADQ
jgi:hypothetical protein